MMKSSSSEDEFNSNFRPTGGRMRCDGPLSVPLIRAPSGPDRKTKCSKEVETLFTEASRDRQKLSRGGHRRDEACTEPRVNSYLKNFLAPGDVNPSRRTAYLGDGPVHAGHEFLSSGEGNPTRRSVEHSGDGFSGLMGNLPHNFPTNSLRLSPETLQAYSDALCMRTDQQAAGKYLSVGGKTPQKNSKSKNCNADSRERDSKMSTGRFDYCGDKGVYEKIGGKLVETPSSSDIEGSIKGLNLGDLNEDQLRKLYDYETTTKISGRNSSSVESENEHTCSKLGPKLISKLKPDCYGSKQYDCERWRNQCDLSIRSETGSNFGREAAETGSTSRHVGRRGLESGTANREPFTQKWQRSGSRGFDNGRKCPDPEVDHLERFDLEGTRPEIQIFKRFDSNYRDFSPTPNNMDSRSFDGCQKNRNLEVPCCERLGQDLLKPETRSLGCVDCQENKQKMPGCQYLSRKKPEREGNRNCCDPRAFGIAHPKQFVRKTPDLELRNRNPFDREIVPNPKMAPRQSDRKRAELQVAESRRIDRNQESVGRNSKLGNRQPLQSDSSSSRGGNRKSSRPEGAPFKAGEYGNRLVLDNKASMHICQMLAKSLPDAKIIPFDKLSEIMPEAELAKVKEKINNNLEDKQILPSLLEDTQLHIDRIKQHVLKKAKECLPNATFSKINQFLSNSKSESEPDTVRSTPSLVKSTKACVSATGLQRSGRSSASFHAGDAPSSQERSRHGRKLTKCNSYYDYLYSVHGRQRRGKSRKQNSQNRCRSEKPLRNPKMKRQPICCTSSEELAKVCESSETGLEYTHNSRNNRLSSGCESDDRFEESLTCNHNGYNDGELVFVEYDNYNDCDFQDCCRNYIDGFENENSTCFETVVFEPPQLLGDCESSCQYLSCVPSGHSCALNSFNDNSFRDSNHGIENEGETYFLANDTCFEPSQNVSQIDREFESCEMFQQEHESHVIDITQHTQNFDQHYSACTQMCDLTASQADGNMLYFSYDNVKSAPLNSFPHAGPDTKFDDATCQSFTSINPAENALLSDDEHINSSDCAPDCQCAHESCETLESCVADSNHCKIEHTNQSQHGSDCSFSPIASVFSDAPEDDHGHFSEESDGTDVPDGLKNVSCCSDASSHSWLTESSVCSLKFSSPHYLRSGIQTDFEQLEYMHEFWRGLYEPTEVESDILNSRSYFYMASKMLSLNHLQLENGQILPENLALDNTHPRFESIDSALRERESDACETQNRGLKSEQKHLLHYQPTFIDASPKFQLSDRVLNSSGKKRKFEVKKDRSVPVLRPDISHRNGTFFISQSALKKITISHGVSKNYRKKPQISISKFKVSAQTVLKLLEGFDGNLILTKHTVSQNKGIQEPILSATDLKSQTDLFTYPNILVRVPEITPNPSPSAPCCLSPTDYRKNSTNHQTLILSSEITFNPASKVFCKFLDSEKTHDSQDILNKCSLLLNTPNNSGHYKGNESLLKLSNPLNHEASPAVTPDFIESHEHPQKFLEAPWQVDTLLRSKESQPSVTAPKFILIHDQNLNDSTKQVGNTHNFRISQVIAQGLFGLSFRCKVTFSKAGFVVLKFSYPQSLNPVLQAEISCCVLNLLGLTGGIDILKYFPELNPSKGFRSLKSTLSPTQFFGVNVFITWNLPQFSQPLVLLNSLQLPEILLSLKARLTLNLHPDFNLNEFVVSCPNTRSLENQTTQCSFNPFIVSENGKNYQTPAPVTCVSMCNQLSRPLYYNSALANGCLIPALSLTQTQRLESSKILRGEMVPTPCSKMSSVPYDSQWNQISSLSFDLRSLNESCFDLSSFLVRQKVLLHPELLSTTIICNSNQCWRMPKIIDTNGKFTHPIKGMNFDYISCFPSPNLSKMEVAYSPQTQDLESLPSATNQDPTGLTAMFQSEYLDNSTESAPSMNDRQQNQPIFVMSADLSRVNKVYSPVLTLLSSQSFGSLTPLQIKMYLQPMDSRSVSPKIPSNATKFLADPFDQHRNPSSSSTTCNFESGNQFYLAIPSSGQENYGCFKTITLTYLHLMTFLAKWYYVYHSQRAIGSSPFSENLADREKGSLETVERTTQTDLCLVSAEHFDAFLLAYIQS